MKKAKSSSVSKNMIHVPEFKYIPPEIWTRILANLPAKTLLTFRCVCKSWCSIIDRPDFISMQLNHCSINSSNRKFLLALEGLGREIGRGYSLTVCQADTLEKTACIFNIRDLHQYRIIGSCNGLLLVRQCRAPCYLEELKELRVSNPCIRKSLRLPKCPLPKCPLPLSSKDGPKYVFGYAPLSQDYKVIAIAPDSKTNYMYVAVYALKNQQWTVRNNGLSFENLELDRMFYEISSKIPVFFQGAIYWIGNAPSQDINLGNKLTHLVSFDFDSENVTYLELPKAVLERRSLRYVFLLRESLAIVSISYVSISIWMLENGAWTQWFAADSSCLDYDVFVCVSTYAKTKIFYCESDDGGCFICGKHSYNIATRQVKEIGKSMSYYLYLETYLDNLACCKEYGQWLNDLV